MNEIQNKNIQDKKKNSKEMTILEKKVLQSIHRIFFIREIKINQSN
jgi:hypothetical protein